MPLVFFGVSLIQKFGRVPSERGVKQEGGVKASYFLALCVDISKTVRDTTKVTILMTNRKWHMGFRSAPRSVTLDGLKLL